MFKESTIAVLILILSYLTYNYTNNVNNGDITIKNIGDVPKNINYSNSIIPLKQAAINNVNNSNKEWKVETITTYINISSMDRDKNMYPNTNSYSIIINPPIKNVHSIEIIRGCIPKGEYTVNENNNIFNIKKGDEEYSLELIIGDYDIMAYIFMLNEILLPLNIKATFNSLLSKINFTTTDGDLITFYLEKYNSPYIEIGFDRKEISWSNSIESYNRVDLFGVQELEIRCNNLLTNNILDTVIFKQCIDVIDFDYNRTVKRYIEPHQEFYYISLEFYNKRYKKLYNFNGLDNSLFLAFNSYKYSLPILIPELKAS